MYPRSGAEPPTSERPNAVSAVSHIVVATPRSRRRFTADRTAARLTSRPAGDHRPRPPPSRTTTGSPEATACRRSPIVPVLRGPRQAGPVRAGCAGALYLTHHVFMRPASEPTASITTELSALEFAPSGTTARRHPPPPRDGHPPTQARNHGHPSPRLESIEIAVENARGL